MKVLFYTVFLLLALDLMSTTVMAQDLGFISTGKNIVYAVARTGHPGPTSHPGCGPGGSTCHTHP